jgi:hypothetical protein
MTDAEIVELSRKEMQDIIDRTDFSVADNIIPSVGLPHGFVELIAADLTELGKFEVTLPGVITIGRPKHEIDALRRHWVYRRKDGKIVTLQLRQRSRLRAVGYVRSEGFINDVGARN